MSSNENSGSNSTGSSSADQTEQLEKLKKLVNGINFAMLTTTTPDGSLRSRPMATQEITDLGSLWFFTGLHSGKVDEICDDQHVNVSYAEPSDSRYVSISGTARVMRDKDKAKELWNPTLKAWFPDGLEDENLALLQVKIATAEYWDSPGSRMVQLYGFIKATLTGQPPKGKELGDHDKIKL